MDRYVLVAGGPDWPYRQKLTSTLDQVVTGVPVDDVLVVACGAARGVGQLAQKWAYARRAQWMLRPVDRPEVRIEAYHPPPTDATGDGRSLTAWAAELVHAYADRLELAVVMLWDNHPPTLAVLRTLRAAGVDADVVDRHPRLRRARPGRAGQGELFETAAAGSP